MQIRNNRGNGLRNQMSKKKEIFIFYSSYVPQLCQPEYFDGQNKKRKTKDKRIEKCNGSIGHFVYFSLVSLFDASCMLVYRFLTCDDG